MNKEFQSYVDVNSTLSIVSIALNGLLLTDGPVTNVKQHYEITVTKDMAVVAKPELKYLYQSFLRHVSKFTITLEPISANETRLHYTIERSIQSPALYLTIFLQLVLSLFFGYGMSLIAPESASSLLVFLGCFLLFFLLYSFLPLICIIPKTQRSLKKQITTSFMPRVYTYIGIVTTQMGQQA